MPVTVIRQYLAECDECSWAEVHDAEGDADDALDAHIRAEC